MKRKPYDALWDEPGRRKLEYDALYRNTPKDEAPKPPPPRESRWREALRAVSRLLGLR